MENILFVTVVNCVDKLDESRANKLIVSLESALFGNGGEQVAAVTKVEHNKDEFITVIHIVEGDDVGMSGDLFVEGELSELKEFLFTPWLWL